MHAPFGRVGPDLKALRALAGEGAIARAPREERLDGARPGGLLLTGALDGSGTDGEAAVTRLRLTLWGGESLAPAEVVAMIEAAGYVDVTAVERQSSRLVPMHARRPG